MVGDLPPPPALTGPSRTSSVTVPVPGATLEGNLDLPQGGRGVVLFAHGSGSSRHSPRNRFVAGVLREDGLATLLMDLFTAEEEAIDQVTRRLRFDIDLLSERLTAAIDWLAAQPETRHLPIGLFGASTGAAGALRAAANRSNLVRAVVSRGGRPDLAGAALDRVRVPTLLIVGENDAPIIPLNETALARLPEPRQLVLVPDATHLFEEPGTLERAAQLARDWFHTHLAPD